MLTILRFCAITRCKFKLFCRFIVHKINAKSKRGHGVHSPFVFDLIVNVFRDRRWKPEFENIENVRKKLLACSDMIDVNDMGAGSLFYNKGRRMVSRIARHSSADRKKGELLNRLASYFGSENILELGTSLGMSTMYLAAATEESVVWTIEGCVNLSSLAESNISRAGFNNVEVIKGPFREKLPEVLERMGRVDFVFFDGDHRKESLLWQFEQCLEKSTGESVFIFDDIHWSDEMEEAWREITEHESVRITIDLFRAGVVFFRKGLPRQKILLNY